MDERDARRIEGIIFDMDGVLVDAQEWHYEALNAALRRHGFEIARQEHETRFDGLPTRTKLAILSRERGLPERLHDEIAAAKQDLTVKIALRRCRPVRERVEALSMLRRRGYRLAVASNAVRSSVVMMLGASGLIGMFECVLSNEDVAEPKPDPEIYQLAFRRLGLAPQQALIVEDSAHGIAAALASGAHVLRVISPRQVTFPTISRALSELPPVRREAVLSCA